MSIVDALADAGLTSEQIDQILNSGILEGQTQKILPREQAMADFLRDTPMARGRSYGGVYRAADPLEHLNTGIRQVAGFYRDWKANQRQQEILEGQKDARRQLLDAVLKRPIPGNMP